MFSVLLVSFFFRCTQAGSYTSPPRTVVNVSSWPSPTGLPLSYAVKAGDVVYVSGLQGFDFNARKLINHTIQDETAQLLSNLETVLLAAGSNRDLVLECSVSLVNIADFADMNTAYQMFFPHEPPSRAAVQVAALAGEARVEMQCSAALAGSNRKAVSAVPGWPKAPGIFSWAIVADGMVYASGSQGVDMSSGNRTTSGDIAQETNQTFLNLQAILQAAGSGLERAVACDVWLRDIKDYATMIEVYARFFSKGRYPTGTAVQVGGLAGTGRVEIRCQAVTNNAEAPRVVSEFPNFPLSMAIQAGDTVYVSGMRGLDMKTGQIVPGGVASETKAALTNIAGLVVAAGTCLEQVTECEVSLTDMRSFSAMNSAYAEFWPKEPPSRIAVQVAALPGDGSVEIKCTAVKGECPAPTPTPPPSPIPPSSREAIDVPEWPHSSTPSPLSYAIKAGDIVYVSGMQGIDMKAGKLITSSVKDETTQLLQNIEMILIEAGSSLELVLECSVSLANISRDFAEMNDAYKQFFAHLPPSRAAVQVGALAGEARVEIQCSAALPGRGRTALSEVPGWKPFPGIPLSWATVLNGTVYASGAQGMNMTSMQIVEGGIAAETNQTLSNLKAILEAAGSGLERAVACDVWLKDIKDFEEMNRAYSQVFSDAKPIAGYPTRIAVQVGGLAGTGRVEIRCQAVTSDADEPKLVSVAGWPDFGMPFSPALQVKDTVYLSGLPGIEMKTGKIVPGGVASETRQALKNVADAVRAAGTCLEQVTLCEVSLRDMRDFSEMNRAYSGFWSSDPPSRVTVQVAALAGGAAVEIKCTAVQGECPPVPQPPSPNPSPLPGGPSTPWVLLYVIAFIVVLVGAVGLFVWRRRRAAAALGDQHDPLRLSGISLGDPP